MYKPSNTMMIGVSMGCERNQPLLMFCLALLIPFHMPSGGTGQMGPIEPFNILIWWPKERYFGTDYSVGFAAGKRIVAAGW